MILLEIGFRFIKIFYVLFYQLFVLALYYIDFLIIIIIKIYNVIIVVNKGKIIN